MVKRLKDNNAFTLIELIVVIAVIGVLVLLAVPKLFGYTEEADKVRITNDIRVAENIVMAQLVSEDALPDEWEDITHEELNTLASGGYLYNIKGLTDEVEEGEYKAIPSKLVKSKLDGNFYANQGGKAYYESLTAGELEGPIVDESLEVPVITLVGKFAEINSEGTVQYKINSDEEWKEYLSPIEITEDTLIYAKTVNGNKESVEVSEDITPDGFLFSTDSEDNATITGYRGKMPADLTIPTTIGKYGETYEVKSIGRRALRSAVNNTVLTIEEGVEIVNHQDSGRFTEVYIPSTVTSILGNPRNEGNAFFKDISNNLTFFDVHPENNYYYSPANGSGLYTKDMTKLIAGTRSGEILDGTKVVGINSFENLDLRGLEIVIPDSVDTIQHRAFYGTKVNKLIMGRNVSNLSEDTSISGSNLGALSRMDYDEVIIPEENNYYKVVNNHILSKDGRKLISTHATISSRGYDGRDNIVIPEGVTTIAPNAINVIKGIASIELPSTLENIRNIDLFNPKNWLQNDHWGRNSILSIKSSNLKAGDFEQSSSGWKTHIDKFLEVFDGVGDYEYDYQNSTWTKIN